MADDDGKILESSCSGNTLISSFFSKLFCSCGICTDA
jgi:hypothetical protein